VAAANVRVAVLCKTVICVLRNLNLTAPLQVTTLHFSVPSLFTSKRNIIFISNSNVSKIFTRMGPNIPIQITILFDIIMRQLPAELFQISQGKSSTEIRTRKVISFTIPRPNKNNRTNRLLYIQNGASIGCRNLRTDPRMLHNF
jgi:hypothetical protein